MSGMAFHYRLWTAMTIGRRQVLDVVIDLRQYTRSDSIGRGMPLIPWTTHTVG